MVAEPMIADECIAIPGLPPMPLDPSDDWAAWRRWRKLVLVHRERVHGETMTSAAARSREFRRCRRSRDYFIAVYGFIYEPRADPRKAELPYVPYPRQVELGRAIDQCLATEVGPETDLVVSKSRDVGATWYLVTDALWRLLFLPTFQGRLVSRTFDLVDQRYSPDSMFVKVDFILDRLPTWLLPAAFERRKHRLANRLVNPDTGAAIVGESTKGGRGGRATVRYYDEACFIEGFEGKWDDAANSTNHRIAVSSESLEEDDGFFNIRTGRRRQGIPAVFTFDYWQVPGHGAEWLATMRARMKPDKFANEIMRDPQQGMSSFVYPAMQHAQLTHAAYVAEWPMYCTIDDGYDDDFVALFLQRDPLTGRFRMVRAYTNSHQPIRFYGSILQGVEDHKFAHDYTAADKEFMEWTRRQWVEKDVRGKRQLMSKTLYFGDRHGEHHTLESGKSPFEVLWVEYRIYVTTARTPEQNTHKYRRDACMDLLTRLDFHQDPGVALCLQAFQEYRFPKRRDHVQAVTEVKTGIHSWASHWCTALEYFAVCVGLGYAAPRPRLVQE